MSGRTKPSGRRRQPRLIRNPVEVAIEQSKLVSEANRANMVRIMREARDRFMRGDLCRDHWRSMATALNTATALSEIGICSDADSLGVIEGAHGALGAVALRVLETGSWTLRSEEVAALDAGLERHAIQLQHCTLGEYERARLKARRREQQALAGNAAPGVMVYGRV